VQSIELAAEIYNHCIALHKRYYKLYKIHLNKNKLQAHIVKLKKINKYKHWNKLHSQAIQDITDRIEDAYILFFRNLKRKVKATPPSFKRRKKYKSFTLKNRGHRLLEDNTVVIAGRKYKFFKSREVEGKVKTVTIKRDILNNLYIFFVCETDSASSIVRERTGKIVGFDIGLRTYLKASDGEDIESPVFFKRNRSVVKKLNRAFDRRQRGSNNREKIKRSLSVRQLKIANQRKDFQFKTANELCRKYDVICIEDLNGKMLTKVRGKKILDLAHGAFVEILKCQAEKYGVRVVEVSNTAMKKTCSECKHVLKDLPLKTRTWICPECGASHDSGFNTAVNIMNLGNPSS